MYTGPIMRTYGSIDQYQNDAANMMRFGYQVLNVQKDKVTDGCTLTAILIIGLLLTPACIGLVILLFLPTAFSTRITAHYYYTGAIGASQHQALPAPNHSPAETLPPRNVPAPVTVQLQPSKKSDYYEQRYSSGGWLAREIDYIRISFNQMTPLNRALVIAAGVMSMAVLLLAVVLLAQAGAR